MNRTLLVRLLTVLALLIAVASVGFGHRTVADASGEAIPGVGADDDRVWISQFVFRTVDEEAGVVCYVTELPEGAGIDCMPIQQTGLAGSADSASTDESAGAAVEGNASAKADENGSAENDGNGSAETDENASAKTDENVGVTTAPLIATPSMNLFVGATAG